MLPTALCNFDQNISDVIRDTDLTLSGSPSYAQFSDGSYGMAFTGSERARLALGSQVDADYGLIACRFKTLQAMAAADNADYNLVRLVGVSTGNYVSLELKYAGGSYNGPGVVFGSLASGGAKLAVVSTRGLDFALGEEHHLAVLWFRDKASAAGDMSVFIALDGKILPTFSNLSGTAANLPTADYLPIDLQTLDVGNQTAVLTNPAECVIQDVIVFASESAEHWEPSDLQKLASERLNLGAATDATIYQAGTPTVLDFSNATLTSPLINVKHWFDDGTENGVLLGTIDASPRDEIWYSLDEGESWTKLDDDPSASGKTITSVFVHQGYLFAGIHGALYRAPYTLSSPTWSSVLSLTIPPPGTSGGHAVLAYWGHSAYGNNLAVCEYEATTDGGAKLYHTTDAGDNWTTRLTLPTSGDPVNTRYHFHGIAYDHVGRLWCATGDAGEFIGYSVDNGENWTVLTGATDASVNTDFQVGGIEFARESGKAVFSSDTAFVPAQLAVADTVDKHPYNHAGAWGKRLSLACLVGTPYNSNAFAVCRLPSRDFLVSTNTENSGTASIFLVNADATKSVRLEDLAGNDFTGFAVSRNYIHGSKWRWPNRIRFTSAANSRIEALVNIPIEKWGSKRKPFDKDVAGVMERRLNLPSSKW